MSTLFQNSTGGGIVKLRSHFFSKNIKDLSFHKSRIQFSPALHSHRVLFCESVPLHLYFMKVNHSLTTMDNILGLYILCIYTKFLVSLVSPTQEG